MAGPTGCLALDRTKCYIITNRRPRGSGIYGMPTQLPHQHHHPGRGHPAASVSPSILRMSVVQRLAMSVALIGVLWAAVVWAMG